MIEQTLPNNILYFGNDWAAESRTSSHHLAKRLSQRCDLLYIECPGLRVPKASGRDLRKAFAKVWRSLRGVRQVDEGVRVWTLFQLPFHRYAVVRALNRGVIRLSLSWLMWRHGIRGHLAWFTVPHLPAFVGRVNEVVSVYYCTDEYATLPDVDPDVVGPMDDETTRRADVVFVVSETLLEGKRRLNDRTHLSAHGVDFDHFREAQNPKLAPPQDMPGGDGPVIGFIGLIDGRFDVDLLRYLGESRPEWTFVIIGRIALAPAELPKLPNVHFLGPRPYSDLPAYGKRFDVAIIPYKRSRHVSHINPLKLREYLAMGKPVVSISNAEILRFSDAITIVENPRDFLRGIETELEGGADPAAIERRMDLVAMESWDARAQMLLELVAGEQQAASQGPSQ